MKPPLIELVGVSRTFPSDDEPVIAVDNIDLSINAGEIVALLGPNGAGKTTTLDMVLGFSKPVAGSIKVAGMTPRQAVTDGRLAGVLQTSSLLRDLTVHETAELIASTYPDPAPIDYVLQKSGIATIANRMVGKCSGGEQQRLRFALALLAKPQILILDEPTVGLDVGARRSFWEAIQTEAEQGLTIIFATHYLQEAEQFSQRTVLMSHGRIVADGATEVVRASAAGRTVRVTLPADDRSVTEHISITATTDLGHNRWALTTTDADAVALHVLQHGGHDLEIESAGLEAAMLAYSDDSLPAPASGVTA